MLERWINPLYLDRAHDFREAALAKPGAKYIVLDEFFHEPMVAALARQHQEVQFPGGDDNFASKELEADQSDCVASELFFSPAWQRYAAWMVGTELVRPGFTIVKLRRHASMGHGLWVHSDRPGTASMTILGYLNRNWRVEDGSLLQFWKVLPIDDPGSQRVHKMSDYRGRRLDFLTNSTEALVVLPGNPGQTARVELLEHVLPEYNRVVLCDFQRDPGFHSISPGNGRIRRGFLQWLF